MTDEQDPILPPHVIMGLKHDVEALKRKVGHPDAKTHELILEIESMKDAVHQLNVIFDKALKEMKDEDLTRTFQSMQQKLDNLTSQNETIAQGMVALSDKLDSAMGRPTSRASAPGMQVQHNMGTPSMPGRTAPRPAMSMPSDGGFPQPPGPNRKSRVGLFS